MSGNIMPNVTPRVPCALQHHWHPERLVNNSQNISEGQRQMAFQNWVAYGRPQSCDVSEKENLMCPLLWCRSSFTNLASTLNHVATCPWLSDGWYWCPHCCRPEQFVDTERSFGEVRGYIPQRKGSKLKRAVEFFKHLGLKKCPKSCRSTKIFRSSNPEYEELPKEVYGQLETSELADTSLGPVELPSESPDDNIFWAEFMVEEGQTYEMEEPPPYITTDISVKNNGPLSDRQTEERSGLVSREIDGGLRRVSPLFHNVDAQLRDFTETEVLVSPILDIQDSFYHMSIPDLAPKNLSKEANPLRVPSMATPWLGSTHSNSGQALICHDPVTASTSSPDSREIESRFAWKPTLAQIEELRDLVHIINIEWLTRLDSATDFRVPYRDYYIPSLFETGIQVLQRCYQNILPTNFKEVFALMHIACGVFYIRHGSNTCYGWGGLFQDFLRWQYAMREERDIHLLIAVTNQLWRPGCMTLSRGATVSPIDPLGSAVTIKPQSVHPVDSFRNGMIIKECSDFLDGFECAGLMEDRSSSNGTLDWYAQNHVTNIQEMLCRITEPLQGWSYFEPLREIIANTNNHLCNGSLRCTREVELWLIATGKPTSIPPQVYERFLKDVNRVCDKNMQKAPIGWRDPFYIADLNKVLAISLEIDKSQQRAAQVPLHGQSTPISPKQWVCDSTWSKPLDEKWALIKSPSSPSVWDMESSTASSQSAASHFSTDSPDSTVSPLSLPSPLSSIDTTCCTVCDQVFTGLLQDRISNLKRHTKTKHQSIIGFKCLVAECDSIFNRQDNLNKHMRKAHPKWGWFGRRELGRSRRSSARS